MMNTRYNDDNEVGATTDREHEQACDRREARESAAVSMAAELGEEF